MNYKMKVIMEKEIIYSIGNKQDLIEINRIYNSFICREGFFKKVPVNKFINNLISINNFEYDQIIVAKENKKIVGYIIATIRRKNEGVINILFVKEEFRNQGIGKELLHRAELYYKSKKITNILVYGYLPIGYPWFIPENKKHYHPCAPGVSVGSPLYEFLLHENYKLKGSNIAFHLDLKNYSISPTIYEIVKKNEANNIKVEFYDKNKHKELEKFCKDINHPSFENVILKNANSINPKPFMVISKDNYVKGWTGALYNEANGRGHIDGIEIHNEVKGLGLGKALFNLYVNELKKNGAKYMTFYTGKDNFARNIYTGAGFEIVQDFAILEKVLKN